MQLEGDWRGGDPEATRRRLRDWLVANDLSGVDVLVLGEEQSYDAPGKLASFYEEFRAHGIPAYYWPSFPLGPTGLFYTSNQ